MQKIWDTNLVPASGRSPGGGHGSPLQYSCLENPMDRGDWQAIVRRVTVRHDWSHLANTHTLKSHGGMEAAERYSLDTSNSWAFLGPEKERRGWEDIIVVGGPLWMVVGVFGFYSLFSETNGIFLSRGVVWYELLLKRIMSAILVKGTFSYLNCYSYLSPPFSTFHIPLSLHYISCIYR